MIVLSKDQISRLHALAAYEPLGVTYDDMVMSLVEVGVDDAEQYIVNMELCRSLTVAMLDFAKAQRSLGTPVEDIVVKAAYGAGFAAGRLTGIDPLPDKETAVTVLNSAVSTLSQALQAYLCIAPRPPKRPTHPGNATKN